MSALDLRFMSGPCAESERLALAKRRAGRRSTASGGIIFVVALTLSVLAAVGAWALQSAAIEVRTAGYERQATQTHYLSEYGAFVALNDMNPGYGPAFLSHAYCAADTCVSVPPIAASSGSQLGKTCARIETVNGVNELTSLFTPPTLAATQVPLTPFDPTQPTLPGSLGMGTTNAWMAGDFWVELSEPQQLAGQQAGYSAGSNLMTYRMTMTAAGITQLQLKSGGATNPAATWGSEGVELQRVRITVGPVSQPRCQK